MKSPFYNVGMVHVVLYLLGYKLPSTLYFEINKDYTLQLVFCTFMKVKKCIM